MKTRVKPRWGEITRPVRTARPHSHGHSNPQTFSPLHFCTFQRLRSRDCCRLSSAPSKNRNPGHAVSFKQNGNCLFFFLFFLTNCNGAAAGAVGKEEKKKKTFVRSCPDLTNVSCRREITQPPSLTHTLKVRNVPRRIRLALEMIWS